MSRASRNRRIVRNLFEEWRSEIESESDPMIRRHCLPFMHALLVPEAKHWVPEVRHNMRHIRTFFYKQLDSKRDKIIADTEISYEVAETSR